MGVKEDKLGIRASSTCPVTFSGCEVPKENVLGNVRFGTGEHLMVGDVLSHGERGGWVGERRMLRER